MKHHIRWGISIVALLAGASVATAEITKQEVGDLVAIDVSVEGVKWETVEVDQQKFSKASLLGVKGYEGVRHEVGVPEVPVVRLFLDGAKNIQINWVDAETFTRKSKLNVIPVMESVAKLPGGKRVVSQKPAAYNKDSLSPREFFKVTDVASIRGVKRQMVTLYPLAINTASGQMRQVRSFSVTYTKAEVKESDLTPVLAFVVGSRFAESDALAQYMSHKESLGYLTTKIVYGQDVNSVDGIRGALQDLYNDEAVNLTDVVIVGDSGVVPAKNARHMSGITDHYYRAIDTNSYESDIGGPDVGLGRISVENESELQTVVDKYMRYDLGEFSTDTWLGEISWIASNDSGFYRIAEGTHNYVINTYATDHQYFGHFPRQDIAGGDKLYLRSNRASSTDIKNAIKAGRAFVTFSGHGSRGGWESFSASTIRTFNEPDYMPVVMGFACNTGDYRGSNGIAETWQRHEFGAVMYFGSVDSSYWDEDDVLERSIYDSVFDLEFRQIGAILNFGLTEVWRHYGGAGFSKYYWESYTAFGDPTMKLRVQ